MWNRKSRKSSQWWQQNRCVFCTLISTFCFVFRVNTCEWQALVTNWSGQWAEQQGRLPKNSSAIYDEEDERQWIKFAVSLPTHVTPIYIYDYKISRFLILFLIKILRYTYPEAIHTGDIPCFAIVISNTSFYMETLGEACTKLQVTRALKLP